MTTVAFRGGVMASDSCWTLGNIQVASATKITRLSSGGLLGQSGDNDSRPLLPIIDKVKTAKRMPTRAEIMAIRLDGNFLLALPGGKIFMIGTSIREPKDDDDIGLWEVNRGFAAVGSGADLALGAMGAGKGAREAVKIACCFDINSKLPVHAMELFKK